MVVEILYRHSIDLRKDDRQGQPDIDSIKQKEDEEWIDRARKGFSDLVKDVRAKKKEIDEKKAKEADAAETTKSTNPTAAWGKIPKYKRTGTNPFAVESSSDEEDIKEGKKRVIGKQGDRSKAEEEESDEEGWTVSINKKGEVNSEVIEEVEEAQFHCIIRVVDSCVVVQGRRVVGRSAWYGEIDDA
ncbi:uncharacterized protein OCT59_012271 [Rhizophagus irregularis]|uniref:Uncharacterized protein n=1 Tax=Rhizophagus irregularis (strain DAOM 181602 / DAOM 197198 / MUCL 43194) TaxID=747089 RepID=A0A2P4QVI3_RHIID|nr:hypothetical protein GLOIN_2v1762909 [Rhizophagus irregularis DAOM 181602=DAOM 197198]POG81673.1 hypothetical protein GLOIN_2v1762909 [Rhizophagus irregularis DAOM 181602=DAOM 197198]UZO01167.1 hypothetical protein OCT59_012271 [Rhizophagus irregularis]|eukprot:XP_025188539.1 hypothetical protein GLOIN_2v1762909 [Rhizophagus irregularis DAOM 181602=DAOM 197198]